MHILTKVVTLCGCIGVFTGQARVQDVGKPDKASIELWINNRISQQLGSSVLSTASEDYNNGSDDTHADFKYALTLKTFSLANCHLSASYTLVTKYFRTDTPPPDDQFAHAYHQNETWRFTQFLELNMREIQPSKLKADAGHFWGPTSPKNAAGRALEVKYRCTSTDDCSVPVVRMTATASQIQFSSQDLDETYVAPIQMVHEAALPLGRDAEGARTARALHDEAIACGAKDVNTNLY